MPSRNNDHIYCKLKPDKIAFFRFLLESEENLAQFTVLDRKTAYIKIFFPPDNYPLVKKFLLKISGNLNLLWEYQ